MNKKTLTGIIIAIVIIVGLVSIFYYYGSESTNVITPTSMPSSHTPKKYSENLTEAVGASSP